MSNINKELPFKLVEDSESLYTREKYLTPDTQAYQDLKLVMEQTGAEHEAAINALLRNDGDIVDAIISLSSTI